MKNSWKWYVYILLCNNGSYYTGMTWNPDIRVAQHFDDFGSQYTSKHRPIKLVYLQEFDELEVARIREKQIKGWSRVKKEKLITGEWA